MPDHAPNYFNDPTFRATPVDLPDPTPRAMKYFCAAMNCYALSLVIQALMDPLRINLFLAMLSSLLMLVGLVLNAFGATTMLPSRIATPAARRAFRLNLLPLLGLAAIIATAILAD